MPFSRFRREIFPIRVGPPGIAAVGNRRAPWHAESRRTGREEALRGARFAGGLGTLSLRARLIALVALVFLLSLALGGTVACLNASRSVEREMRAAMTVARQTVEAGIADLGRARDPGRELERLVGSFRGNRHVRVAFAGAESMVAAPAPD